MKRFKKLMVVVVAVAMVLQIVPMMGVGVTAALPAPQGVLHYTDVPGAIPVLFRPVTLFGGGHNVGDQVPTGAAGGWAWMRWTFGGELDHPVTGTEIVEFGDGGPRAIRVSDTEFHDDRMAVNADTIGTTGDGVVVFQTQVLMNGPFANQGAIYQLMVRGAFGPDGRLRLLSLYGDGSVRMWGGDWQATQTIIENVNWINNQWITVSVYMRRVGETLNHEHIVVLEGPGFTGEGVVDGRMEQRMTSSIGARDGFPHRTQFVYRFGAIGEDEAVYLGTQAQYSWDGVTLPGQVVGPCECDPEICDETCPCPHCPYRPQSPIPAPHPLRHYTAIPGATGPAPRPDDFSDLTIGQMLPRGTPATPRWHWNGWDDVPAYVVEVAHGARAVRVSDHPGTFQYEAMSFNVDNLRTANNTQVFQTQVLMSGPFANQGPVFRLWMRGATGGGGRPQILALDGNGAIRIGGSGWAQAGTTIPNVTWVNEQWITTTVYMTSIAATEHTYTLVLEGAGITGTGVVDGRFETTFNVAAGDAPWNMIMYHFGAIGANEAVYIGPTALYPWDGVTTAPVGTREFTDISIAYDGLGVYLTGENNTNVPLTGVVILAMMGADNRLRSVYIQQVEFGNVDEFWLDPVDFEGDGPTDLTGVTEVRAFLWTNLESQSPIIMTYLIVD